MRRPMAGVLALAVTSVARAQTPPTVTVTVDATDAGSPLDRVLPFYGYDRINYTTAPEGQALLQTLVAANSSLVVTRAPFASWSGIITTT